MTYQSLVLMSVSALQPVSKNPRLGVDFFFLSVSRRHFKFDVRCFDRCLCKPFQFLKTPDVKCKEFYFYCLEASSPPYPPRAANPTCLSDISKGTRCEIPLPSDSVKGVHKSTWTHQCPCTAPPPCLPRLPHDNTHTHTHTWVHLIGETGSLCSSPGLEQDSDVVDETCTRRQFEMKYIVIFSDTIETSDKSLKQVFFIVRRRVVATATL